MTGPGGSRSGRPPTSSSRSVGTNSSMPCGGPARCPPWNRRDHAPHPRRRGQPAQPQTRARRPRIRGLRGHGGRFRRGRSAPGAGGSAGPGVDGPCASGHRRDGDTAAAAKRCPGQRRAGGRRHRVRDGRGPAAGVHRGLRRLRREADQRASVARPGRGLPGQGGQVGGATAMNTPVSVLAVDDQHTNLRLLDAVLTPRGHRVLTACSGPEALDVLETEDVDIVLLDILMPGMDGHEVCRRIRARPATEFLPVVMITASGTDQRLLALQSGADDFITKPFDQGELLARVASLARIKRYHDTIRRQADELAAWNTELESRVATQVAELDRANRLRRFLSPQLADLVIGDEHLLESHRREIVVLFADIRNFTPFAETSEPEEVMGVLAEYHLAMGELVHKYQGTLERFTGDGIMV